MSTKTTDSELTTRISRILEEKGIEDAIKTTLLAMEDAGLDPAMIAKRAIARAGGVMSTKEVAEHLSSHGIVVATTNVGRVTHGMQPFARVAGGTVPLYFKSRVDPHRRRLMRYRQEQLERKNAQEAADAGELAVVPQPFDESKV